MVVIVMMEWIRQAHGAWRVGGRGWGSGSPLGRSDPVAMGPQESHGSGQFRLSSGARQRRGGWFQLVGQAPVEAGIGLRQVPKGGAKGVGDGAHRWECGGGWLPPDDWGRFGSV